MCSCERVEYAADKNGSAVKRLACNEMSHSASDVDGFFGTTYTTEVRLAEFARTSESFNLVTVHHELTVH